MAKNDSIGGVKQKAKENFVRRLAQDIRKAVPGFSRAKCREAAGHVLFLLANPHLNPLRAKAAAAGLL